MQTETREDSNMTKRIWEQRCVSRAMCLLFRLLNYLWPKDRSLIVFYGGRGVGYSDNTRYLFERFIEAYSGEFSILWVTPSEYMLRDTSIEEKWRRHMVYMYSTRGILSLLRTKTVFFSWAPPGFPGTWFSKRTVTIQLWHGIPIKRIGMCTRHRGQNRIDVEVRAFQKYDYWICSSKIERNSIALCTGIPIDDVKITGYPRNDYLVKHKDSRDSKLLARFPYLEKKVILYAPTWHPDPRARFFPFEDFRVDELSSMLEENDAYMILRTHYANDILAARGTVDCDAFKSSRIIVLNRDSLIDVQDILPYVDVLISDYSGIWVDFLLLDRPVVFVPYDLATYEEVPGLLYDYDYVTPGTKVHRFSEMLSEIENYLSDPSRDSERRKHIKRMFHEYDDGLAYKRIHQLVKDASSEGSETE